MAHRPREIECVLHARPALGERLAGLGAPEGDLPGDRPALVVNVMKHPEQARTGLCEEP